METTLTGTAGTYCIICPLINYSWPEEGRVRAGGALEGRVLEVVGRFLEGVPPRQRQDLLVGGDEVGHPGNRGDDERLPGGVDVGLRPRQHPHARQLMRYIDPGTIEKISQD
jgi:hypothetical protein